MTMPKNLTAFRGQILIWVDVSKRAVGSTIGAWSDILPGDLVVQPLPLFRPNWLNFSFLLQKYENFYNCKYKVPGEGQGVGGGARRDTKDTKKKAGDRTVVMRKVNDMFSPSPARAVVMFPEEL